jgi:hypothetical protein
MRCDGELDPLWVGVTYDAATWHFHSQLLKRYGVVLAPGEYSLITSMIRKGTALLVRERKDKTAIYSVRIPSVHERVYVQAKGDRLLTAFPPNKVLNAKRRELMAKASDGAASNAETHDESGLDGLHQGTAAGGNGPRADHL